MRKRITDTSVQSYREIRETLGDRQRQVYDLIQRHPNRTDRELASIAGVNDPNQIRPRRTELTDKGLIAEGGRRRCTVTGKVAKTWRITRHEQLKLDLEVSVLRGWL